MIQIQYNLLYIQLRQLVIYIKNLIQLITRKYLINNKQKD